MVLYSGQYSDSGNVSIFHVLSVHTTTGFTRLAQENFTIRVTGSALDDWGVAGVGRRREGRFDALRQLQLPQLLVLVVNFLNGKGGLLKFLSDPLFDCLITVNGK